jgi:hypothetical protein
MSQRAIVDLRKLGDDLQGSIVPEGYSRANVLLQRAVSVGLAGLNERVAALQDLDNAAWRDSNAKIRQASGLFQQAYARFPAFDRPTPAPYF